MKNWIQLGQAGLIMPFAFLFGCALEPGAEGSDFAHAEATRESEQALGSTKQPVDISNWNGLVAMVSDGNYRLTADINASGKTWTPNSFSGTFDGNDKTISNLTINVSGDAGFFRTLNQAIVRKVRFTNLKVTGTWFVGGLAGVAQDSQVERVSIEGTMTATDGFAVGGIFGSMAGGSLYRSYAKGTAQSALYFAGGLAGVAGTGASLGTISESYSQVTVSPNTSAAGRTVYAGGIAGYGVGVDIHDVYATGNVTGRGGSGGLVGYLGCNGSRAWLLYKGIYRGDVVDRNAPSGGWAGTVGGYGDCTARFTHLSWDSTVDPSTNWLSNPVADLAQRPGTTTQHRAPTIAYGGFFCIQPNNCPNDNNFETSKWDAGTSSQHHILKNMPGPNVQIR